MKKSLDMAGLAQPSGQPPQPDMAWIPGGTFLLGSDHHYPEEAPAHAVTVAGFWMDIYAVTNAQFQRFVEETDYVTVAERPLNPHDYPGVDADKLLPGSVVFQQPAQRVDLRNPGNWWQYRPAACWLQPEGPGSSLKGRWQHPVVHIAYEDATAYAAWCGKTLPSEAQWERAARGGLEGAAYVWGDTFAPGGTVMANTWQGAFPWQNLRSDGRVGTMPVGSYAANGYGLYEMAGNVWEWTTDWYQDRHPEQAHKACCIPVHPKGGTEEGSFDPQQPEVRIPRKVLKGGSFLCAVNYCQRYRPAARIPGIIDTSTCHIGFRCILAAPVESKP